MYNELVGNGCASSLLLMEGTFGLPSHVSGFRDFRYIQKLLKQFGDRWLFQLACVQHKMSETLVTYSCIWRTVVQ